MRVDPANQNEHRVKPRGVSPDTVETTPSRHLARGALDTSSDVIVDMLSDEIDSVRLAAIAALEAAMASLARPSESRREAALNAARQAVRTLGARRGLSRGWTLTAVTSEYARCKTATA